MPVYCSHALILARIETFCRPELRKVLVKVQNTQQNVLFCPNSLVASLLVEQIQRTIYTGTVPVLSTTRVTNLESANNPSPDPPNKATLLVFKRAAANSTKHLAKRAKKRKTLASKCRKTRLVANPIPRNKKRRRIYTMC